MRVFIRCLVISLFVVVVILVIPSFASADCGDIIYKVDYEDGNGLIEEREPIKDCTNPFNADSPEPFNYELTLAGQTVNNNSVISVIESEPVSGFYSIDKESDFSPNPLQIFREEGSDFRQVFSVANEIFEIDQLSEGEYVAVFLYEAPPVLVKKEPLWKQWLNDLVLPSIAYAFYSDYMEVVTVTFSVKYEPVTPVGASSVLFLPGVEASRLYTDGVLGTENQLWEPNRNADVEKLKMTESGMSVNNIYTKDVIDEINILPLLQGNIYKDFLNSLEDLKEDEIIKDYKPFAYDWRYSVQDIVFSGTFHEDRVEGLIDEVESLSNDSFTGKVTIIGHSNGGLLAKSLITELDRLGKSDLVDKVIFIGTPHLGTPKAIATILHGYDQQKLGGIIIEDKTARDVMNNMSGAYGLLPSEKYITESTEPTVYFKEGESTQQLIDTYGFGISSVDEYIDFLNGKDGRTNDYDNISSPYTTNSEILNGALNLHKNSLDNWVAPTGIEVYDVVGVGLQTIKALEYRNVQEVSCYATGGQGNIVCAEPENILRPYAHFTQYGDETVVSLSAEAVVGDVYYFDFASYRDESLSINRKEHVDFTEIEEIQSFVKNVITGTSTPLDYFSTTTPNFTQEYEIISIDSPVRVFVEDSNGNKTGLVEENGEFVLHQDIPNSQYFEFAGTKYLITPKDIDTTTTLHGEDYGGYTLTVATLTSNDEQKIESEIVNAVTTPDMTAVFSKTNGIYSSLTTDMDGDGKVDFTMSLDGVLIDEVTFDTLRSQIQILNLSKQKEKPLLILVNLSSKSAEKIHTHQSFFKVTDKLLLNLSKLISLYKKKRWIAEEEEKDLQSTILLLRANLK